jgi:hypothetical protein
MRGSACRGVLEPRSAAANPQLPGCAHRPFCTTTHQPPTRARVRLNNPPPKVTPAAIAALADEVEARLQGGLSPRPLLSVPHILADESSCYYHG